ncbi:MAG: SsrA-binding protein SmpB [Pseudomonadota bacterium]
MKSQLMTQTIASNRRARHEYELVERLEVGIILTGSEVKSLRRGQANLTQAHAGMRLDELYLFNLHINEYQNAARGSQHDPARPRKLLLHRREQRRLIGAIQRKGQTLIPLHLYFNKRGLVKLELALGRGRKLHDKREAIKEREWKRRKDRDLAPRAG